LIRLGAEWNFSPSPSNKDVYDTTATNAARLRLQTSEPSLPLHRFADTLDRLACLPACPTNSGLNLPHGLVVG
jgi:hypothetical protein